MKSEGIMVSSVYRKKRDRPVVRIVIGVIIVSLLVIPVASFFYHLNGNSYDFSRSEILIVPSDSMDGGPTGYEISTIPKDSLIMAHILLDSEKDELKVGDVITFYQEGIYKVHRIVSIDGKLIVTKGDANPSVDHPIGIEEVKGKVVGVSSIVGDLIFAIRESVSTGLLLLLALVIVIIMVYEIRVVITIVKEDNDNSQNKPVN